MRKIFLCTALIFSAIALYSFDVDRDELAAGAGRQIEFFNYQGPHAKIDTREEIMGIGSFLALGLSGPAAERAYFEKYRVIHAVDRSITMGLDADIIVLEQEAEVDHINNVRLIIAGYLRQAYGYNLQDALILAEFVTYYNAVFRGDIAYLSTKYKPVVMRHLSADNAGIALRYTEWPGKTRLIIPLSERSDKGGLGSLVTDELTDERVIDDLRTQDGMGIDQRKEITELKEREVDTRREELREEQETITQRESQAQAERDRIEREKAEIERRRQEMERTGGSVEEQTELTVREMELRDREEALKAEEGSVEEGRETIAREAQRQEERQEQIQREREQIAADERSITDRPAGPPRPETASVETVRDKVYFLHVADIAGEPLGQLLLMDTGTGRILGTSSVNTIRNRSYDLLEQSVVALAGRTERGRAVRLILLHPSTLQLVKEGTEEIFKDSVVVASGSSIYAVVSRNSEWYVGLFNKDLELLALSSLQADPYTSFTLSGQWLFFQDPRGDVVRVNQTTLRP